MPADVQCHSCGSRTLVVFYEVEKIPVHSCLLMPSRAAALQYPKRDLRLAFCQACGFIQNIVFDPSVHEYSARYEETQAFSPRFNQFAGDLAGRLIERYDLREKDILEIGCGKGEFLVLLCEMGHNRGLGIDPGCIVERISGEAASRIRFIQDFYSERYSHLTADFVCCRHTLEHIQPTRQFVQMVRAAIGRRPDTIVFFEVPDVSRVLKEQAFWDIYYEHCSYFSLGSLTRLFRSCGFEILDVAKAFDGQYLLLEARPSPSPAGRMFAGENDLEELARDVQGFEATVGRKLLQWKRELRRFKERGQRTVIWGSGSKAVAYLTSLGTEGEIDYVVDINPHKHGMYLAGTGHEIVPPMFLKDYRPDVVIVMNPIYGNEIRHDLEKMGITAELIAV
jgi:2-polyprenyl-3-methyl-5-hydroxy-6-metoxy-1,4-benzoquinol methylase